MNEPFQVRLRSTTCLLVSLLGVCILAPAGAQQASRPAKPPGAQGTAKQDPWATPQWFDSVTLYFTARDNKGKRVNDLIQDDFRVSEDGRVQKPAFFSANIEDPVVLGVLVDVSRTPFVARPAAKEELAAEFFRAALKRGDTAFVAAFNEKVSLLTDFTDDPTQLGRAVSNAMAMNRYGVRPLFQVIEWACTKLWERPGRRALVVLTAGGDTDFPYTYPEFRRRVLDTLAAAQRNNTVVHLVGVLGQIKGPRAPLVPFGTKEIQGTYLNENLLDPTGGRAIGLFRPDDLRPALLDIAEEIRYGYTLRYYPTNRAADGGHRKVKIETSRRGVTLRARTGYYAPKG